jgi:TolB-like protein/Flp pilus assembly protein TadD
VLRSTRMIKPQRTSYEFGPFRLNAAERRLLRDGEPVPLQPKVFETLLALVENAGHLVVKEDLLSRLWPDVFVEEATLARNISDLRKALAESSGETKYIETVPKAGYRFIALVTRIEDQDSDVFVRRIARSRFLIEEEIAETEPICSIAVLPFKRLATDVDEYLSLGLADALITRLSKIHRIRVRPTSAIAPYSGSEANPAAIGRELGVESVLEGHLRRSGERIRVTVQLVSVDTGASLWAEKFDENFTDIFGVEDSISERVAYALVRELTAEERLLLRKRYTDNTDAYQLYLKGRYYWNKRAPEWLKKGADCFRQAIDLDPAYASAYAGLSDSYTLLVVREALPPEEGFARAKVAAARALQIDEDFAEAHASLGHALLHNWEWTDAEKALTRALELNPAYPSAHHWYSEHLTALGRCDESISELKLAGSLDPLSLVISADLGRAYYYARQYDQVMKQEARTLEMDPKFWLSHLNVGRSCTQEGLHEEAIDALRKACELSPGNTEALCFLGFAYAAAGQQDQAVSILAALNAQSTNSHVPPYHFAIIHAGLGDKDQAFAWLEQAFEKHAVDLFTLKVEPMFDVLRADARFEDLLVRVGLGTISS